MKTPQEVKPRYKPGVDIEAVRPEYRYLLEDFSDEEMRLDARAEDLRREAFSFHGVLTGSALIALYGIFAFAIFTSPDSYGCFRGRCGHSYSAGIVYALIVGAVVWVGARGFYIRFLRKQAKDSEA